MRLGCRSDIQVARLDDIIVTTGGASLKAGTRLDGEAKRTLIKAVRGGEHVELSVTARTFRQRDGSPNRNYLRLNPSKLDEIAASYVGKPMLLDHRSWSQSARIGTITSSSAEEQGHGWTAFLQTLQVVKPEAVISVLDGTLDRFSIAWSRIGAVTCSVHKTDVTKRSACDCWPGDTVEVDGVKHTVEFEFQNAEGTEVSGVNSPAVSGTRIEDVRAALAAELGLADRWPVSEREAARYVGREENERAEFSADEIEHMQGMADEYGMTLEQMAEGVRDRRRRRGDVPDQYYREALIEGLRTYAEQSNGAVTFEELLLNAELPRPNFGRAIRRGR